MDFYPCPLQSSQYREIDIAESETEPLLGMALLYKYRLQIDNIEDGKVKIETFLEVTITAEKRSRSSLSMAVRQRRYPKPGFLTLNLRSFASDIAPFIILGHGV